MTRAQIRDQARHAACAYCGADPDQPCDCPPGGVHYRRVARACRVGYISLEDFGDVIGNCAFSADMVFNPGRAP